MSRDVQAEIGQVIRENKIVLFMKGNPNFPQCGFSAQVAGILNELKVPYVGVNVLADPAVRQGIKELYIGGEFVGGCDITTELYQAGKLQEQLDTALAG